MSNAVDRVNKAWQEYGRTHSDQPMDNKDISLVFGFLTDISDRLEKVPENLKPLVRILAKAYFEEDGQMEPVL